MSDWRAYPLLGGGSLCEPSVWQVTVQREGAGALDCNWTCVVKLIRQAMIPSPSQPCPCAWDNEHFAFLDHAIRLPKGLCRPKLWGVELHIDRAYLFMEDLAATGNTIALSDLPDFAKCLGQWNSMHFSRAQSPAQSWLDWYVNEASPVVSSFADLGGTTPLLQPLAEVYSHSAMKEFWTWRGDALRLLHKLGYFQAHGDLVSRNIFARRPGADPQYILIDWSLRQVAPIGMDMASLLFGSCLLFAWPLDEMSRGSSHAIDAYMAGLGSDANHPTRERIEIGLYLSAALRYIAWGGHRVQMVMDPSRRKWAEKTIGKGLPEAIQRFIEVGNTLGALGLEALRGAK